MLPSELRRVGKLPVWYWGEFARTLNCVNARGGIISRNGPGAVPRCQMAIWRSRAAACHFPTRSGSFSLRGSVIEQEQEKERYEDL
jgi:hypothetical protein